jgi:GTP pyrophosphokinase
MTQNTIDDLLASIGYGKVSAHMVANKLAPDKVHIEPIPKKSLKSFFRPAKPASGGMKISGMDNMLIHLSKCCNPVPGDKILGFITRGRGVSVHTADCTNIGDLTFDKERLVDVSWGDLQAAAHSVKISVQTQDKPGLLASVSSSISAAEANITHAEVTTNEDRQAMLNFTIDIRDVEHLNKIIKNIEAIKGVIDVKRVRTTG